MTEISCLRSSIRSGGQDYPVLVGYLGAREILRIAEVPSFSTGTDHAAIARNVLNPPIEDWQRPLDASRISKIQAFFDDSGELMPNPVLLSENTLHHPTGLTIEQEQAAGAIPTNIWKVSIPSSTQSAGKPLWILDGQHRINGLAQSAQRDNPVPFVLLLNLGITVYQPETFAKLFAQVTTLATPLEPIHQDWLTYAFRLESYSTARPDSRDHRDAMTATAHLCETQYIGSSRIRNPFFNSVRFNPHSTGPVRPPGGGFEYKCTELKELIRSDYYSLIGSGTRLPPEVLAAELAKAYVALQHSVTGNPRETVFFGESASGGQKPMQDAFVVGVLAFLRTHGQPTAWRDVLADLAFPTTEWDFKTWVETVGGAAGTLAKKIGWKVFRTAFIEARPPGGSTTIVDYLQGNGAKVVIEASHLSPAGGPARADRVRLEIRPGTTTTPNIQPRRYIKIAEMTDNIGQLTIRDERAPLSDRYSAAALKRGTVIDTSAPNPLSLIFGMEYYGNNRNEARVRLRWQP